MKNLLVVLFLFGTSQALMASDIGAGEEKFKSTCVACHGALGERKALGISQVIANIGDEDKINQLITNVRDNGASLGKNMAMVNTVSGLSDKEISDLSAFVATLKK